MARADKEIDIQTTGHDLATETLGEVSAEAAKAAKALEATQEIRVDTGNEFGLGVQMGAIRPIQFPVFTTRQQAWRFAAWLMLMAETLEEEPYPHTFEEITEAIKNT